MPDTLQGQRTHPQILLDQEPDEPDEREHYDIQSLIDRFLQLVHDLGRKPEK